MAAADVPWFLSAKGGPIDVLRDNPLLAGRRTVRHPYGIYADKNHRNSKKRPKLRFFRLERLYGVPVSPQNHNFEVPERDVREYFLAGPEMARRSKIDAFLVENQAYFKLQRK